MTAKEIYLIKKELEKKGINTYIVLCPTSSGYEYCLFAEKDNLKLNINKVEVV